MNDLHFRLPAEGGGVLGGMSGLPALYVLKSKLLAAVSSTLDRYRNEGLKLPPKDEFLAKAKAFMQGVAAAIDIPGIGDFIETTLEAAVINALMPLVEKLYDRFATEG